MKNSKPTIQIDGNYKIVALAINYDCYRYRWGHSNYDANIFIFSDVDKQEIIADMVHHFIIPEVQKTTDREKLKEKQKSYLKNAHKLIYEPDVNYYKRLADGKI